ncbi:MarR family winged helix-turn-helix transcriptional regulator [Azospirillum picis]|uniref:DNA-binding MarR family transcriptional regulator n=1 Tax=Azospirillum picis TaxID=488438 RepID=A0ABU0MDX4_9PROT|nr:MarR family transcriptional regulator [Azospirillum picis]MBP2297373.1 DNA-binding MarR family transcriptional regulator [Azospirillum picis]MDQ0531604.1 DNA-binding MarR family transcriptional regulator [Azospirillum picis]
MAAKAGEARGRKGGGALEAGTSAGPDRGPAGDGHADIRLWLRLLFCASRIESVLQSRIAGDFGITLARFDLLAQLERVEGGLTMTEASQRMMVSNGAVTSLVDRLVEDGFVVREVHPQDRRTNLIRLTGHGRQRFLAMAKEHEQWVVGLLAGLDEAAKATLLDGLGRLKHHLETSAG